MSERDPRYFKVYQDGDDRDLEKKIQQIIESGAAPGIDTQARAEIEEIQRAIENGEIGGPVTPEKASFMELDRVNLIDESKLTRGMALSLTNGALVSNANYSTTDYIAVEAGQIYTQSEQAFKAWYDTNKTFINGVNAIQGTAPSNAAYIRVSIHNNNLGEVKAMLVKGTQLPPYYESYNAYKLSKDIKSDRDTPNLLSGLKWAALGDSITVSSGSGSTPETGYVSLIATRNNMTIANFGFNGTSIAKNPNMVGYEFTARYRGMPDDADIITVFGGTNDFGNNLPIGSLGDTTDSTLYGAMKVLIEGLITKYPTKRIGFILPLPRVGNIGQTGTLKNYVAVIKEMCALYSVPVLDLYNGSGIAPDFAPSRSSLMTDGMHPTPAAHLILSRKIEAFLRTL